MVVRWLMYLVVAAITALLAVLYPDYLSALLFVGVLFYPAVAWAELMLHRIFLSVQKVEYPAIEEQSSSIVKAEKAVSLPVFFQISNKSLLPVWQLRENYQLLNQMTGQRLEKQLNTDLESYGRFVRKLSVLPAHYGLYTLGKGRLRLSDMFGLLWVRKRLPVLELFLCTPLEGSLNLLPETLYSTITVLIQEAVVESNKGEEEPELKEIREFRPGDRQNRIHQRLSAKLEKPMVRVLETEELPGLLLIPKLCQDTPEANDRCLEFLAALTEECLNAHIRAEVCLPEGGVLPVGNQAEREICFYHLLATALTGKEEAEPVYSNAYQMIAWIDEKGITYQTKGGEPG